MGKAPERASRHYAQGALMYLVPILTTIMTKQVNMSSLFISILVWIKWPVLSL